MTKKKVIKRKVKAPDRDEEIEIEEEVDDDSGPSGQAHLIGHPLQMDPQTQPATPQVAQGPDTRLSVAQQHAQNEREALVCPDCVRMAPRHCARHKLNLPV